MNENNNNQVKDKIINYYDLSNENSENEENLSIYKINETELKALSYEISTISNEKNDEKCNKLNKRFEKIKNNIEGQKNKINIISKQVKRFSKDLYSENKKVMNQLCDIKNEINEEIMGNEQRKKDFRINFNYKIYNSFTYPVWLQESLKDKI